MKNVLLVIFLCLFFVGCATQESFPKEEDKAPVALIEAGKKLGVDFSDPIFAQQTKCYKNPFEDYYLKNKRSNYVICYSDKYPLTRIFWVDPSNTVEDLVQKNADEVMRRRIKDGFQGADNKKINLILEKDGIFYHTITMDSAYNLTQATFFVPATEEREINLTLAIMVRGGSLAG